MSIVIDIAEGIKDELNNTLFSQSFIAKRLYVPRFKLEDMEELQVSVVPKKYSNNILSRPRDQRDYEIDVAVQKKLEEEDNPEIDPLSDLVEEIVDHFRALTLDSVPAQWIGTQNDPIYAPEHLDQLRQFTSIITITYRHWALPSRGVSLINLGFWLDAADPTVIDADPVGQWSIKGGDDHFLQSVAGDKPDQVLAEQNGNDVVRFDGTSDHMNSGDVPAWEVSDFTMIFAMKWTGAVLGDLINIQSSNVGTGQGGILVRVFGGGTTLFLGGATDASTAVSLGFASGVVDSLWNVWSVFKSGTNAVIRKNGIEVSNFTGVPSALFFPATGKSTTLCGRTPSSPAGLADVDLGEFLFYTVARDIQDIISEERRLKQKWATP